MDTYAPELYEVLPRASWSRRGFVVTSLATGFALAAGPISAQTITTDTNGLDVAEVKVPTADGEMPAYRAMPAPNGPFGGGPFATVLVVQEIFGVHEHIKDICRRLAKAGYFAIAPELYARQGDPSTYNDIPKLVADIVSKVPDYEVLGDLDATVIYSRGTGKADTKRLAITGFCWGGRPVWLYAAHNPGLKASFVVWPDRPAAHRSAAEIPDRPRRRVEMSGAWAIRRARQGDTGRKRRSHGGRLQGRRQDL